MPNRLTTVETAIFNYINSLLTSSTGAIGELPRAATSTAPRLWSFGFTGGSEALAVEDDKDIYAWDLNAAFRGIYTDREQAMDDLWAVMDDLPWSTTDIASVMRVDPVAPPTILREVVELENDLTSGGDMRVWAVELTLNVTFERS